MIKHLDDTIYKICGAYYEIYHDDGTVELKVPVCGKWKMIDILPTREHFIYGKPKCNHLAWLDELYFIDGGKSYWAVGGWTKGLVLYKQEKIASSYEIVTIDGKDYLFKEWKTGDYSFGGGRSYWYVFTRE